MAASLKMNASVGPGKNTSVASKGGTSTATKGSTSTATKGTASKATKGTASTATKGTASTATKGTASAATKGTASAATKGTASTATKSTISAATKGTTSAAGGKSEAQSELIELGCFHYFVPPDVTEELLEQPGDFLIWQMISDDNDEQFVLGIRTDKGVKHFPITFLPETKMYHFIESVGKPSITELCEHHRLTSTPIGPAVLKTPIGVLPWELTDEKLQIENKILGNGKSTVVKQAKWLFGDQWIDVAFKQVKLEGCKSKKEVQNARFPITQEFQAGRAVRMHPFIATTWGIYIESKQLGIITGFCDGGTLDKHIQSKNTDDVEKLDLLFQAANALSYVHGQGLIHRNICSRKILITKGSQRTRNCSTVKISDFGLARDGPVYQGAREPEIPFYVLGPESLNEKPTWQYASDSWSFGVVIWHVFENCKRVPYADQSVTNDEGLKQLLNRAARLQPQLPMPKEVKDMMELCFNANPPERPDTDKIQECLYRSMSQIIVDRMK